MAFALLFASDHLFYKGFNPICTEIIEFITCMNGCIGNSSATYLKLQPRIVAIVHEQDSPLEVGWAWWQWVG